MTYAGNRVFNLINLALLMQVSLLFLIWMYNWDTFDEAKYIWTGVIGFGICWCIGVANYFKITDNNLIISNYILIFDRKTYAWDRIEKVELLTAIPGKWYKLKLKPTGKRYREFDCFCLSRKALKALLAQLEMHQPALSIKG